MITISKAIKELQELMEKEGDLPIVACSHGDIYLAEGHLMAVRAYDLSHDSVSRLSVVEKIFPEWCGRNSTLDELKPKKVALLYNPDETYICEITDLNA